VDAVAWVFPAERKLKLRAVADRELLRDLLSARRGTVLRRVDLVHFVPEHSYTARILAQTVDGTPKCEYLKIYYNDDGARTARTMVQLNVQSKDKSIAFADSVSYLSDHRMLLQSALPRDPAATLSVERAAAALGRFHQLRAAAVPTMADPNAAMLNAAIRLIETTFPPRTEAASRVAREVKRRLAETGPAPDCLLHGDAHLGNLIPLTNGKTGVIDLDGVMIGPPEHDLASFYAFKLWIALRERHPVDGLLGAYRGFVAAYNKAAPNEVTSERAYIVLAEKLLSERVCRGISRGKLAAEAEIETFLSLARCCLRQSRRANG
jgi:hypothetical protein